MSARLLLLTIAALLASSVLVAQESLPGYKAIQPVGSRPFPENERTLLKLRDHPGKRALKKMRAHAWDLFVGLTGDDPAWQTWYTKCDVKLAIAECPEAPSEDILPLQRQFRSFEIPVQSLHSLEHLYPGGNAATPTLPTAASSKESTPFQTAAMQFIADFRTHPQYASVLFNKQAADRVRAGFAGSSQETPFSRESIVLKTVWEVIHPSAAGGHVAGPLSTWNPLLWNEIHSVNRDPKPFAKYKVMIDTTPGKRCEDRDYDDSESVPLSCFYFHQLTADDVKLFPRLLAEIDDQHLLAGDYLILVGMHVATRELPQWVWATFWWENQSVSDPHAKGRPPGLEMRWRHFLMDTTLSALTPYEKDGGPKVCFNPYLETDVRIRDGIISNCVQCHSLAGYAIPPKNINAYEQGILGRDGKTLADGNAPDASYFANFHKTNFLWSLVPQQDSTLKQLLRALQVLLESETK